MSYYDRKLKTIIENDNELLSFYNDLMENINIGYTFVISEKKLLISNLLLISLEDKGYNNIVFNIEENEGYIILLN